MHDLESRITQLSIKNLDRLIVHLQNRVDLLNQSWNLILHLEINQSLYMQKIAELCLIKEQLLANPSDPHLHQRALCHYASAFLTWRADRRKIPFPK